MVDAVIPSALAHDQAIEVVHSNATQSSTVLMSQFVVCVRTRGFKIENYEHKSIAPNAKQKKNVNNYRYSAPHPFTNDMRIVHIRVNW